VSGEEVHAGKTVKRFTPGKKTPASAGAACPHPHREGGEVLYKQSFIIVAN